MGSRLVLAAAAVIRFATAYPSSTRILHPIRRWHAHRASPEAGTSDWFKDGLKFSCGMCGNCCSGSSGSVRFTNMEAEKMSAKLQINLTEFYDDYCRKRGSGSNKYYELKEKRSPDGYDCIFLDSSTIPNKRICSLYEARPLQCQTWPFWEENLSDPETWRNVGKGSEGCAGIGKGNEITPYSEIVRQRDETDNLWKKNKS